MNDKKWFKLDNAGRMYSSITSSRVTTLFRISADLKEDIDEELLQKALDNIIKKFPYFNVNLKRGLFWYYFDINDNMPKIEKEKYYPCMYLEMKKKKILPFRVMYFKNKLSVEFSHIITDGTGAMTFLKALIIEYFRLQGIECEGLEEQENNKDIISNEETEDSFRKHYNKKVPSVEKGKRAFHFPFKLCNKGEYYIVTGIIDVNVLKEKSKNYGVTITQFLIAVYLKSILEFIEQNKYKKKPIVINVPVNLRNMYKSKTMKNFFISVTPTIDPRLGEYTFEEILEYVNYYMKTHINEKYINQIIARNVRNEKNIFLRIFPLIFKNLGMPFVYNFFGEANYTSSFSNMGKISMPKELEDYIQRVEAYPPPSEGNLVKVVSTSYKDKMYITFGKLTTNKEIEKIFFAKLRKMGIPVKIETNQRTS